MKKLGFFPKLIGLLSLGLVLFIGFVNVNLAAIISNVQGTKHNLSAAVDGVGGVPTRNVKAASESQICVFCHTPHNATQTVALPLWNRSLTSATYTPYISSSMDAITTQPTGGSKMCLSCHDGTLAIGTVGVLNGQSGNINMSGVGLGGVMPSGAGLNSGFTRNIGTDLSNDHPISFPYDSTTSAADGELRIPPVIVSSTSVVANREVGTKPVFPLENDQMQCTTCHDPHLKDTDTTHSPLKFLRGNRLQQLPPFGAMFSPETDIMCLACHEMAGDIWANSAHANELVADETYNDTAAATREFALGTTVWQASCLNCHDTHTVAGARRLLREGTSSIDSPQSGGSAAGEQTCYQCHSLTSFSILDPIAPLNTTPNLTPDIKSDFEKTFRMPISLQPEVHDIGGSFDDSSRSGARCINTGDQCGKDFVESQALLGKVTAGGDLLNRHAECTDCHNPHRATKKRLFNDTLNTPDLAGTHKHGILPGDTLPHDNLASGSLRGTFGVEPTYLSAEFGISPTTFEIKRGVPEALTDVTRPYVTREYQVCLKCHSKYAFDVPEVLPHTSGSGGTQTGTNGATDYIDTAMEIQAPLAHQGEPISTVDSGAASNFSDNNYRSWHPVMDKTGRTAAIRSGADANLWRTPWNGSDTDGGTAIIADAVGNQTMYCSDCHGSETLPSDGVVPNGGEDGSPWGPHGSNNAFILKGRWDTDVPNIHNPGSDNLCFRCHDENQYADSSATPANTLKSGFSDVVGGFTNLHQRHAYLTTQGGEPGNNWPVTENGNYRCTMCHTGTAHGWKNKGFLVNLNDLGSEVFALGGETAPGSITLVTGDNVPKGTEATAMVSAASGGYSNGAYYRGALLGVTTFKAAGNWTISDCSSSGCHAP